jgi:curved DNA-binding protein CbpA
MPLTDDFWAWVSETVAALDELSYYQIVGVPEDADSQLVADSYYTLVRRVHPDRHTRESAERRAGLVRLYARLGEAYRVLGNPALRERYDRALAAGAKRLDQGETSRPVDPARDQDPKGEQARSLYHRGLSLLEQRDKRGARAQLQLALGFEPDSKAIKEALERLETTGLAPPPAPQPEPEVAPEPEPSTSWLDELPDPNTPPPQMVAPAPKPARPRPPGLRKIRLRCSRWEQVITLHRRELQSGTIFLRAPRPLEAGTLVQVVLALPDGSEEPLDGRVERAVAGEHPGMVIRFHDRFAARGVEQKLREVGYDR